MPCFFDVLGDVSSYLLKAPAVLCVVLVMACIATGSEPVTCPTISGLSVEKGRYIARPGVVFLMENYSAKMIPESNQMPRCTQKVSSIDHGRIIVSGESLGRIFDQKMQKSGERKISDLRVETKGNHIAISGKVHKVIGVPFTIEGPVDSPDGRSLRLHAEKVKAAGFPIKGLLDMVGVELGSMLNPGSKNGVVIKDDDLYFQPEKLGHVRGHILHVQVSGDNLIVDFGEPDKQTAAAKSARLSTGK